MCGRYFGIQNSSLDVDDLSRLHFGAKLSVAQLFLRLFSPNHEQRDETHVDQGAHDGEGQVDVVILRRRVEDFHNVANEDEERLANICQTYIKHAC